MNVNKCLYCDCYDEDFGCTMSSMDKWYACPLEANDEELEEMFNMSNANGSNLHENTKGE